MSPVLTRILYILAAAAGFAILWPYPVTLFLAACMAVLTLPLFRRLQRVLVRRCAITVFASLLSAMVIIPVSIFILLVLPQAQAGIKMFNQLRESNFQLPPHWLLWLDDINNYIQQWPWLKKALGEVTASMEKAVGEIVSTAVSSSFGFVGGTMLALWLLVLFVTFTTLFVAYADEIKKISRTILNISGNMLDRFLKAEHRALRGILLGILLVAMAQGILCGLGFAVAGVKQPAFWGLLATLVAPIPVVGTALVWVPLCLMLWFTGNSMAALGLAAWGTIAVAGIDNILRPLFLRSGIDASVIVLIISILCGMASMGAAGLIAGPVLLAFAIQAIKEGSALRTANRMLASTKRETPPHG